MFGVQACQGVLSQDGIMFDAQFSSVQVRDLMIFLEARDIVSGSGGELQQGSASVAAAPKPRRNKKR